MLKVCLPGMEESLTMILTRSEYFGGLAVCQFRYLAGLNLNLFIDDALLPGLHFRVPLFIVLDTLQSSDPHLKRTGETWLRSSLRSYIRFDPFPFARLCLIYFPILESLTHSYSTCLTPRSSVYLAWSPYKEGTCASFLMNAPSISTE